VIARALVLALTFFAASLVAQSGAWADSEANSLEPTTFLQKLLARSSAAVERVLRVSNSDIEGNYYVSEREILALSGLDRRPWLWEFFGSAALENLKSQPWIADVRLDLSIYPASATLTIEESVPWLVAEFQRESWLVARSGRLLQPLATIKDADIVMQAAHLSRLDGIDEQVDLRSPTRSNRRLNQALEIVKKFEIAGKLPFTVERYTLVEFGGIKVMPAEWESFPPILISRFTFEEASRAQANLLRVLTDLRYRGESSAILDLRFRNQVVVRPAIE